MRQLRTTGSPIVHVYIEGCLFVYYARGEGYGCLIEPDAFTWRIHDSESLTLKHGVIHDLKPCVSTVSYW